MDILINKSLDAFIKLITGANRTKQKHNATKESEFFHKSK